MQSIVPKVLERRRIHLRQPSRLFPCRHALQRRQVLRESLDLDGVFRMVQSVGARVRAQASSISSRDFWVKKNVFLFLTTLI